MKRDGRFTKLPLVYRRNMPKRRPRARGFIRSTLSILAPCQILSFIIILPFVTQPSSACQQLLYHLSLCCQIFPSAITLIDRKKSLGFSYARTTRNCSSISSACIAPISFNRTNNAPTILYISHRNNANNYTPFLFVIPTLLTIDALVISPHQLIAITFLSSGLTVPKFRAFMFPATHVTANLH